MRNRVGSIRRRAVATSDTRVASDGVDALGVEPVVDGQSSAGVERPGDRPKARRRATAAGMPANDRRQSTPSRSDVADADAAHGGVGEHDTFRLAARAAGGDDQCVAGLDREPVDRARAAPSASTIAATPNRREQLSADLRGQVGDRVGRRRRRRPRSVAAPRRSRSSLVDRWRPGAPSPPIGGDVGSPTRPVAPVRSYDPSWPTHVDRLTSPPLAIGSPALARGRCRPLSSRSRSVPVRRSGPTAPMSSGGAWRGACRVVVAADRRQLRQRLQRRGAWHRRRSRRADATGRLWTGVTDRRSSGRPCRVSGWRPSSGLVLAAATRWWLLAVGAACDPRRVGLHRWPQAVRLPRARRSCSCSRSSGSWRPSARRTWRSRRSRASPGRRRAASGCWRVRLLVVNNLRDIPTDTVTGKRTLAVRLGDRRTRGCTSRSSVGALVLAGVCALDRAVVVAGAGRRTGCRSADPTVRRWRIRDAS